MPQLREAKEACVSKLGTLVDFLGWAGYLTTPKQIRHMPTKYKKLVYLAKMLFGRLLNFRKKRHEKFKFSHLLPGSAK